MIERNEKMEYKVSVIIPVYKVRKRIFKTLNSIKSQTISEIEFLFIDDGSPDDSSQVIENSLKNTNINYRIIEKQNGGVSSARNLGIIESKGEYIQFLDSDDYIDDNMIEELYTKALENNADVVYSGFIFEESDGTKISDNAANLIEGNYSGKEAALGLIYGYSHTHIMSNLFKRSLIIDNNIKFDENRKFAEDIAFEIKAYAHAKNVYCLNKINTHYVKWGESVTNNVNMNFLDMYYSNVETREYLVENFMDKDLEKGMDEYRIPVSIIAIFSAFAISKKLDNELEDFINKKDVKRALNKVKIKRLTKDRIKYYILAKGIVISPKIMKNYYSKIK